MTDAEIIKALECCAGDDGCNVCPMYKPSSECITELQGKALDLINRQKAEIERLQEENKSFADIGKMYSEIKSEVIKKFAERLKTTLAGYEICFIENQGWSARNTIQQVSAEIDNLVKEMAGEG